MHYDKQKEVRLTAYLSSQAKQTKDWNNFFKDLWKKKIHAHTHTLNLEFYIQQKYIPIRKVMDKMAETPLSLLLPTQYNYKLWK